MKTWIVLAITLLVLLGQDVLAQPALNLYTWSEYIDPSILEDFERTFGVKVNTSFYESSEDMVARLQTGGTGQYDLIVPSDYIVSTLLKLKLLRPLNHAHIPNLKNLDTHFANLPYDPGNRYTVGYQVGTVGIAYRKDRLKNPPETWGLVFDAPQQRGPFVLLDSPREMIGCALKYLGKSLNSTSLQDLKQAGALLKAAKVRALGFDGGVGGKNKLLARSATVAVVYNGDAVKATEQDPDIGYFIPREGSLVGLDSMAVPARAPHPELAEKFINFILDARIGARLSNYNRYATPNAAARKYIRPADLQNPGIYPSAARAAGLETFKDIGTDLRLYDAIWTAVKAR